MVEYTDPYCTWRWGSEPILRKIRWLYGDQVKISFKMGGLVEDIEGFYGTFNKIGGEKNIELERKRGRLFSEAAPWDPRPLYLALGAVEKGFKANLPLRVAAPRAQPPRRRTARNKRYRLEAS